MTNDKFISYKDLRPISFRVDPKLYTKCKIYCADQDLTIQKFFESMLEDFFSSHTLPKIPKPIR